MKRSALIITSIILFFSFAGQACTLFGNPAADQVARRDITLNYWRVIDNEDTMSDVISAYQQIHPNVTINYRSFRYDEYEQELLNALAEDRGPDIFSIPSTWVTKYQSKIEPMPDAVTVGFLTTKGTIKKTVVAELAQHAGYTPKYMYDTFVTTVADDVLRNIDEQPRVMGLPLSVDNLALFYNRDLLNNAGIAQPPTDWNQLAEMVSSSAGKGLTVIDYNQADTSKSIRQFGIAMGSAKSVQRAGDIVAALMMQSGAKMSNNEQVTFQNTPDGKDINPAVRALRFYTDFAYNGREVYSWDPASDQSQDFDSFEAFKEGRAAFFLGYSYHAAMLRDSAPGLRFGVAPLPQVSQTTKATAANYWVETVSKKTQEKDYAWDFLMFATSADNVKSFLEKTQKPTALRSLISDQLKNDALAPFAQQLLYAVSWYRGATPEVAEKSFLDMIAEALTVKGGDTEEEDSQLQRIINQKAQSIQTSY